MKDDITSEASFGDPSAIAADLYTKFVAEFDRHVIRKVSVFPPLGVFTDTLVGRPDATGATDGPASIARLTAPGGLSSNRRAPSASPTSALIPSDASPRAGCS